MRCASASTPSDFESERFAANLVERLGWAVVDATEAEYENPPEPEPTPDPTARESKRPITGQRENDAQQDRQLEPVGTRSGRQP